MKWALFCSGLLAGGCALAPVEVDLIFPREENFLYSEAGRLLVYDNDLGDCPMLLGAIMRNDFGEPVFDSERQPICAFRDGGVAFPSVPAGPHAYVVVAWDDSDAIILQGCAIAEVYEGAGTVEVTLFPTDEYAAAASGELMCLTAETKCAGGC